MLKKTDPKAAPNKAQIKPPVAQTARQEGAQGRAPGTAGDNDNGSIDTSDPKMHAVKY